MTAAITPILAATETTSSGGGESSGSFLVSPEVGLMIWTLLVFAISLYLLAKYAFPRIQEALDKRQHLIEESIDTARQTKAEAEALLQEYRERLKEARKQAEEIVVKARKAAEVHERESTEEARAKREEIMAQARRDIEAETRRAIQETRNGAPGLTITATEKVPRKTLAGDDQRRLVEEALGELDFTALSGGERNN